MGSSILTAATPDGDIVTEEALTVWLGRAALGETLTYHCGHLARDVAPSPAGLSEPDRLELIRLARRALWAAEQGLVHLLQQRHGPDDYAYVAVARARPRKARSPLPAMATAQMHAPAALRLPGKRM